ncbi:hypothetical protein BJV82DRAFT_148186 [Fennellomyces sp. T-0311]|nr:hypothetical protein BJV82DRAFT_148186 [Fennellomyces sp. T-0311]
MVTTVQRPKKQQKQPPRSESPVSTGSSPAHSTSDLSARLAAVMAEKRSISRTSSLSSASGRPDRSSMDGSIGSPKAAKAVVEKVQVDEPPRSEEPNAEEEAKIPEAKGESAHPTTNDTTTDPLDLSMTPLAKDPIAEPVKAEACDAETAKAVASAKVPPVELPEVEADKPDTDKKDTILQQREEQLFQAMQNIANLHDQIHTLQEQAEKQASERARAQTQLEELESQLTKANRPGPGNVKKLESTIEDLKQQLATKTEQVQGLMEEGNYQRGLLDPLLTLCLIGEKLSKTELKHTTTIKKLRAEKQDHDRAVAELQKKIDRLSTDLVEANAKIIKATELEKRLQGLGVSYRLIESSVSTNTSVLKKKSGCYPT